MLVGGKLNYGDGYGGDSVQAKTSRQVFLCHNIQLIMIYTLQVDSRKKITHYFEYEKAVNLHFENSRMPVADGLMPIKPDGDLDSNCCIK
jgi:hypothetical protein